MGDEFRVHVLLSMSLCEDSEKGNSASVVLDY